MARFQGLGAPLIAVAVGVASGVYIFKPLIENSMDNMKVEMEKKKALESGSPPPSKTPSKLP